MMGPLRLQEIEENIFAFSLKKSFAACLLSPLGSSIHTCKISHVEDGVQGQLGQESDHPVLVMIPLGMQYETFTEHG